VLTALDNTLARTAAGGVGNEDVLITKRRIIEESDEEDVKAADLSIIMSSDDNDSEDDDNGEAPRKAKPAKPPRPPKPSMRPKKQPQQQQAARRRRRRSSARFLRLTGRFEEDDDEQQQEEDDGVDQQEHLGEMYKRAIRMNAENRINAGNSWGLRLIENIDKFLVDEQDTPAVASSQEQDTQEKRVNFTKASCTLDASVKIYSYRVDDVHLTSYKVLANLNRTDTGKKNSRAQDDNEDAAEGETQTTSRANKNTNERRGVTETLESNIGMCVVGCRSLTNSYSHSHLFPSLCRQSQHEQA